MRTGSRSEPQSKTFLFISPSPVGNFPPLGPAPGPEHLCGQQSARPSAELGKRTPPLPAPAGASPALPPGASSGLPPSDTGPGGLPGRCWRCSSREALQTAQGKIFNSASHFNLKSEKKNLKRMTRCQRLRARTTERLIAAPRTRGNARRRCRAPALVGARCSSRAATLAAGGNQSAENQLISHSCNEEEKGRSLWTWETRELGQI